MGKQDPPYQTQGQPSSGGLRLSKPLVSLSFKGQVGSRSWYPSLPSNRALLTVPSPHCFLRGHSQGKVGHSPSVLSGPRTGPYTRCSPGHSLWPQFLGRDGDQVDVQEPEAKAAVVTPLTAPGASGPASVPPRRRAGSRNVPAFPPIAETRQLGSWSWGTKLSSSLEAWLEHRKTLRKGRSSVFSLLPRQLRRLTALPWVLSRESPCP